MRLTDIALVNIPDSRGGSTLRGTQRLLRDLVAVGIMQRERPTATQRLESRLGEAFTRVLFGSLADTGPDAHSGSASHGLRPQRAA